MPVPYWDAKLWGQRGILARLPVQFACQEPKRYPGKAACTICMPGLACMRSLWKFVVFRVPLCRRRFLWACWKHVSASVCLCYCLRAGLGLCLLPVSTHGWFHSCYASFCSSLLGTTVPGPQAQPGSAGGNFSMCSCFRRASVYVLGASHA